HRDLRLATGLSPEKHYARQNTIQLVQSGDTLAIDDLRTAELQSYTTLADVFSLYKTLTDDPAFNEFEFVTRWPDLAENEKLALYTKYASHELHVFLAQKDPGFFDTVVAPYLDNKKDLTFIDELLLGIDLTHYLEPWRFAQLNTAERAMLAQQLEARRQAITTNLGDLLAINHSTSHDNLTRNIYFGKALRGRGLAVAGNALWFGANADTTVDPFAGPSSATFAITGGLADEMAPAAPAMKPARSAGRQLKEEAKNITSRNALEKRPQALGLDAAAVEDFRSSRRKSLDKATAGRGTTARLYIPEQQTKELAENNYHHLPIADQNADLVGPDRFWLDYAGWDRTAPFISEHFPAAAQNRTAALLALAVLDLPFKAKIPDAKPEENSLSVTPGTPVIAFYRALREAPVADGSLPLLVSQTYFRTDDPTELRDGVQVEKTIDGEFLSGIVYTSKVVVSNPSATPRQLSVMTQIPTGSLPIAGSRYTDTRPVGLDPYSTAGIDYHFYFPAAGEFATYPAHVTEGESVVAHTDTTTFNVVENFSEVDRSSWPYLSQNGSKADVLTYLNNKNLQSIDLSKIAWRLKSDPDFFDKVIATLGSRLIYDHTLYSYAALHGRDVPLSHYLENRPGFITACGPYLESPLLTIDPVERKSYQHLEYAPLVNARSHKL
ncbi:MAG: hypothetical protein P8J87_01140, partial [Verrucomicrobiales bacterium]|nr:hypothetical protein [Verrucomicrobiales bacterium]